jgi:hypothetical protein
MLQFSTTKSTNSKKIVGRAYNPDNTLKGLLVKEGSRVFLIKVKPSTAA